MPLTKPPLATVSPGEPVTAQGWNAMVNGLSALYDAVRALGGAARDGGVSGPEGAPGLVATSKDTSSAPSGPGVPGVTFVVKVARSILSGASSRDIAVSSAWAALVRLAVRVAAAAS